MGRFSQLVDRVDEDVTALAGCRTTILRMSAQTKDVLRAIIVAVEPGEGAEEVETLLARAAMDLEVAAGEVARLARNQAMSNPGQAVGYARDYVSRQADKFKAGLLKKLRPHLRVNVGFGEEE